MLAGAYLAEYGRYEKLSNVVRFINDILLSAPSIIIGLFVYMAVVKPTGGFSGFAGAIALAVIGAAGLTAVLRLWPDDNQTILPHDHPDLPPDHPHLAENGQHHAHAVVIDDLHRRWPKAT
jgi:hypothetical protein